MPLTSDFRFHRAVRDCINHELYGYNDEFDWFEWRYCYEGGAPFRDEFLEKYPGKEDDDAFARRKKLTPIPTYAKRSINRVRNSLTSRLVDVNRNGGSDKWSDAITGQNRGVDLRGSEMGSFIAKKVIAEMLVMSQVGVLIDAPNINPRSQAEVPANFSPYLQRFRREDYPILIPAREDSVSDWAHLLLKVENEDYNALTGEGDCEREWRYYWLEDDEIARFGKVNVAFMNDDAQLTRPIFKSNLDMIPFVLFDINQSLIADACHHDIAILNMTSADTSYGIDANYSTLTRQRGNAGTEGSHLDGGKGEDTVKTGSQKGLWYGKGYERPGYISPDVAPIQWSIEQRRELKTESEDLVFGHIQGLGGDGSVEDGLAFIGRCMQTAERRIWDHWVIFEETRESKRKIPTIHYPDDWSLKTDEERLAEATAFMKLANVMVGRLNKQAMSVAAADKMHRGRKSTEQLNKIKAEIKKAPYAIADPDVVFKAKDAGLMSRETGSLALGNLPGESEKAEADDAARAAAVAVAQSDAAKGAARGNPEMSVDPKANKIAREGETEGAANLKETKQPGRPPNESSE